MAETEYTVNHPMAVTHWQQKLNIEAIHKTQLKKFMGTDTNSLFQVYSDFEQKAGYKMTIGLRMQLDGDGVGGDDILEGNEEALVVHTDSFVIDQVRNAVLSGGVMSEQRVPFSVRQQAYDGLLDWVNKHRERALFYQLAGATNITDTKLTGSNATVAPSSDRIIYANQLGSEASVAAASSNAKFDLNLIDKCIELAETAATPIRPIKVNGKDMYVMFIHPHQKYDIRTNTAAGQWFDINQAELQGGKIEENNIFSGALGVYNNVIIHTSYWVPSVTTNVRRAVFCGAQAAIMGYGRASAGGSISWYEETADVGNKLRVGGGIVWGAKKAVYNSSDFATITVPTYAVSHA